MPRYIDADKLIEGRISIDPIVIAVNCSKTADVRENMHGKWVWDEEYRTYICNKCNKEPLLDSCENQTLSNFCPYCGAKMDKEN